MLRRILSGHKVKYEVCIPPLSKPFYELSHKETEDYFQWHMTIMQERIDYLSGFVSRSLKIDRDKMNLSPESLVPLWTWFLSVVKTVHVPLNKAEIEGKHFTAFQKYMAQKAQDQFTTETELILTDIGMYLGEVFVKNVPGLYWSYYEKPKSDVFVNMPVVLGFIDYTYTPPFRPVFAPVHMSRVQAANIWDNSQKVDDLFNIYSLWAKKFSPHKE